MHGETVKIKKKISKDSFSFTSKINSPRHIALLPLPTKHLTADLLIKVIPKHQAVSTHRIGSPKNWTNHGLWKRLGLNEEHRSALRDTDVNSPVP